MSRASFWRRGARRAARRERVGRRSADKYCGIERLEERTLLTSNLGIALSPYRNPIRQADVNNDSRISPIDALVVINELNRGGARQLNFASASTADGMGAGASLRIAGEGEIDRFFDTNGDGRLSAMDALVVINKLNTQAGEQARLRLAVTDEAGNPITSVAVGNRFLVKGFVQDLRLPANDPQRGVFSAYTDVTYSANVLAVNTPVVKDIVYGDPYVNGQRPEDTPPQPGSDPGVLATPQLLDDIGAFAGFAPLGSAEQLLFSVPFTAEAAGLATFIPAFPSLIVNEIGLFGADGPLLASEVDFVGTTLTVGQVPNATIGDVSIPEGASGQTLAEFTVTLSSPAIVETTIDYAVTAQTATAGEDFQAVSGTVTIQPGESTATIFVPVFGDPYFEPDETFLVTLSNPANAVIVDGTAIGTIVNDDVVPSLSINDVTRPEPATGSVNAMFTVTLSSPSTTTVTVDYTVTPGTATEGSDYTKVMGTLIFPPNVTSQSILVPVLADSEAEASETFNVVLSNVSGNATIGDDTGLGTIQDPSTSTATVRLRLVSTDLNGNQDQTFSIGDRFLIKAYVQDARPPAGDENRGVFQAFFDTLYDAGLVTLSNRPISFEPPFNNFQNGDISQEGIINEVGAFSAESNVDPNRTQEQLFWTAEFVATGNGLAIFTTDPAENLPLNEIFVFGVDDPVPASEVDYGQAFVQIGPSPEVSISDVTVTEGDLNTPNVVFTVTLATASLFPVQIGYQTANGTATAGADYTARSGVLDFAPGQLTQTISIPVLDDTVFESTENFFVDLVNPVGVSLPDRGARGTGTILDNELPGLSINDRTIVVGTVNNVANFVVRLDAPADRQIAVKYGTADGTARAGIDYLAADGELIFNPGEQTKVIPVTVLGSLESKPDQQFFVNLVSATNALILDSQAVGTITQIDPSALSGFVYVDGNNNGVKEAGEGGIPSVTIQLLGTTSEGDPVSMTAVTEANGAYSFNDLPTGTYTIREIQPAFFRDGKDTLGSQGGDASVNDQFTLFFANGSFASGYNFGELGLRPEFLFKNLFLSSAPPHGTLDNLNLAAGDLWLGLDGGFAQLDVQAISNTGQGVYIILYDVNLNQVAVASPAAINSLFALGAPGSPYFLRIGGGSRSVSLTLNVLGGLERHNQSVEEAFASTVHWLDA